MVGPRIALRTACLLPNVSFDTFLVPRIAQLAVRSRPTPRRILLKALLAPRVVYLIAPFDYSAHQGSRLFLAGQFGFGGGRFPP